MATTVTVEHRGHLSLIGVNRPDKRNAWNVEIIQAVAAAYTELANEPDLRVGVIYGHGADFTAGMDLMDVAPKLAEGKGAEVLPVDLCDPWDYIQAPCPKPIVAAVHGRCLALGVEIVLACQATVAADDTVFSQAEVARGIVPMGGAAHRLPQRFGQRGLEWLLTARNWDAHEALEVGLVNELVEPGRQLDRAIVIAEMIAANAPLAVQGALAISRAAERAQRQAAADHMMSLQGILTSEDAVEGVMSLMEKRTPVYHGR